MVEARVAGVATAGAAMMAELRSVPLGRRHEPRRDWWSAPVPTTRDAAMLGAALNFLLRLSYTHDLTKLYPASQPVS